MIPAFGALTSLTGGGGLSAPVDMGSDTFGPVSGTGGSFGAGYVNSSGQGVNRAQNNNWLVVGAVVVVAVLLLRRK